MIVRINSDLITNRESFHDVFAEAFGFPAYYGRNMDAWIDCMSLLNSPEHTENQVVARRGEIVVLHLENADSFKVRCRDLYDSLVECSAFVNFRQIEKGNDPVLALSFYA